MSKNTTKSSIQNNVFDNLKNLLKEIFSLNYPDLDFGIYRIAKFREKEINDYLETKLKEKVEAIVSKYSSNEEKLKEIENQLKEELNDNKLLKTYTSLENFEKLEQKYKDDII
jgi:hypothetical protein